MHQKPSVWAIVLVPIVTLGSVFLTLLAWFGHAAVGRPDAGNFVAVSMFGLAFAVLPAVGLLISGLRRRHRVSVIVGAVSAAIGTLAIGAMVLPTISRLVHTSTLVAQPFTADEVAFTPAEAKALGEGALEASREAVFAAGFEPTAAAEDGIDIEGTCNLGNLTRSEQYTIGERITLSAEAGPLALAAIDEHWRSLGYRVQLTGVDMTALLDFGRVVARWNAEALALSIQVRTNCYAPAGSDAD